MPILRLLADVQLTPQQKHVLEIAFSHAIRQIGWWTDRSVLRSCSKEDDRPSETRRHRRQALAELTISLIDLNSSVSKKHPF